MRAAAATARPVAPGGAARRRAHGRIRSAAFVASVLALAGSFGAVQAQGTAAPAQGPAAPSQRAGVPLQGEGAPAGPNAANASGQSNPSNGAGDDFPRRRAGLWEIETVGAHAAGLPAARYCIDDSTDRAGLHLDRSSGAKGSCSLGAFRRAGEAWSAETICRQGRTSVVSRSIASGDFETTYRIDTVIQYDPPLGGVIPRESTAIRGRWVGPCLAGQRAGDVSIPGMGRLNMKDGSVVPEETPEQRKTAKPRRAPRAADG